MKGVRHASRTTLRTSAAAVCAAALVLGATATASASSHAARTGSRAHTRSSFAAGALASRPATCVSRKGNNTQAAKIQHAITAALNSRFTSSDPSYNPFNDVSVQLHDDFLGIYCWYHSHQWYYSASAVKATILAALLLKAQDQHRGLTSKEKSEAQLMITLSDNNAATYLWNDVGLRALQQFLNVANMKETQLNTFGAWGLTHITANDETLLLRLLMSPGNVLTTANRDYELTLMNQVVSYENWGVKTGVPKFFTWHIKNGWAPLPNLNSSPWVVNSIGCFLYKQRDYTLVVLTDNNPGSGPNYGIATIETIARAINDLVSPNAKLRWAFSRPQPLWAIPDETLPPLPPPAKH